MSYVNDYVVTETGRISIPDVVLVRAAGLTEAQLEQEISDILSPSIIKIPSVEPPRFFNPKLAIFRLSDMGGRAVFEVSDARDIQSG